MIVDANVLSSAILGRSLPLLLELRLRGIDLLMPQHQFAESRAVTARKAGWGEEQFEQFALSVIEVLPMQDYARLEHAARSRLDASGQSDWPVLAAAMEFSDAIWSNDRDFFGVGVAIWTTANIKFASAVA